MIHNPHDLWLPREAIEVGIRALREVMELRVLTIEGTSNFIDNFGRWIKLQTLTFSLHLRTIQIFMSNFKFEVEMQIL